MFERWLRSQLCWREEQQSDSSLKERKNKKLWAEQKPLGAQSGQGVQEPEENQQGEVLR